MDHSNCLSIVEFASDHGFWPLHARALAYLARHFAQVAAESDEFLKLSPEALRKLLDRSDLFVRGERQVFEALVRWARADLPNRWHTMRDLLAAVRLYTLAPDFLQQQMISCDVFQQSADALEYLGEVTQQLRATSVSPALQTHLLSQRSYRSSGSPVCYIVGGYLRQSLPLFEYLDPGTKSSRWEQLPSLPSPRSGLAGCSLHNYLFVAGGRSNIQETGVNVNHQDSAEMNACLPISHSITSTITVTSTTPDTKRLSIYAYCA